MFASGMKNWKKQATQVANPTKGESIKHTVKIWGLLELEILKSGLAKKAAFSATENGYLVSK